MLDYMKKGEWIPQPNFRYGQGRPQFNASSSIQNSVPLRIQLKEFMEEQGKINKDTITKFKAMDKILENIDGKVTEVRSSNLQVLNMMKMLETQVAQLAGRLSSNEGKLPGQPQSPETAKAIQKGKHEDEQFNKFVEMVRRLSINMPLLDALQVPTYSRYFKDIMGKRARYRQTLSS